MLHSAPNDITTEKYRKCPKHNPDCRSRLVGREIKKDQRPDLFAATPPLESLRFVVSLCASTQGEARPHRLLTVDVKRAYFYAPVKRPIYIVLPAEDRLPGDEEMVGRLNLSLYGTRDAAQNWSREYTRTLTSCGFIVGSTSPCNFYHPTRDLALTGPKARRVITIIII